MVDAASIAAQNAAIIAAHDKAVKAGQSPTSVAAGNATGAAASQTQLSSDINFFLKMLTTQLKNQDPSSPLDTNQFTQQIAQYSSVQQQVNMNQNLEKLLAANKVNTNSVAVSYIGREVESEGNTGAVIGGQGAFAYVLPVAVTTAKVTITDSTGRTVFTGNGNTASGRNIVVWDGKNSSTGEQEPDGTYTITVAASDINGNSVSGVETRAVGIVSGVETDTAGNTMLNVGDKKVNFNDVLAVRVASRANVATQNTDNSTSNDTTSGGTT